MICAAAVMELSLKSRIKLIARCALFSSSSPMRPSALIQRKCHCRLASVRRIQIGRRKANINQAVIQLLVLNAKKSAGRPIWILLTEANRQWHFLWIKAEGRIGLLELNNAQRAINLIRDSSDSSITAAAQIIDACNGLPPRPMIAESSGGALDNLGHEDDDDSQEDSQGGNGDDSGDVETTPRDDSASLASDSGCGDAFQDHGARDNGVLHVPDVGNLYDFYDDMNEDERFRLDVKNQIEQSFGVRPSSIQVELGPEPSTAFNLQNYYSFSFPMHVEHLVYSFFDVHRAC